MSPVAALPAVLTAEPLLVVALVLNVPHEKCTQLFVLSAVLRRRYHSCPRMIAPSIVAHVMIRCASRATKREEVLLHV